MWGRERKKCVKAAKSCKITCHSHQILITFLSLSLSPNDWCSISAHSVSFGAEHTVVHCFVCIELASGSVCVFALVAWRSSASFNYMFSEVSFNKCNP